VRSDGAQIVLKIATPSFEGEHELDGLRLWDGDPAVRVLEADAALHAMLLERCEPGTSLRDRPEPEQDEIIVSLLRRLWRESPGPPFRPLSVMLAHWAAETRDAIAFWSDAGLVREGLRIFDELSRPSEDDVLLATDLHAGNVLRAQRQPWLVIDPKPFVGDRTYDATQHLLNCPARMRAAPIDTIARMADLLDVDAARLRLWMLARSAAEPRNCRDEDSHAIARALA
jgi:streptomycin 6-kinase